MLYNLSKNFIHAILLIASVSLICADSGVNPAKPRHCFSCQGINCQRTSKVNETADCSDLLDICVTIFDGFTVTAKGCYLDLTEKHRDKCDARNNPECLKCFGQLCNNKGRTDFKCIACNSNDNSKCATDTAAMTPIHCDIPTAPNSYCYVRDSGESGFARGCLVHQQEQMDCMEDEGCSMCLTGDEEACNSYRLYSNSEAAPRVVLSLSAIVTLLLAKFLR